MKSIYGEEIGTTVDLRNGETYEMHHPWPTETSVSAGACGVVIGGEGGSYTTAFIEVYPPEASFIRGEGTTLAKCEDAAWAQYQKAVTCPSGKGHEWSPLGRGHKHPYRNGAGFCTHCGTFKSKAFTGEELGQLCHECGVGTTWSWVEVEGVMVFGCKDHPVERPLSQKHGVERLLHLMTETTKGEES